MRCDAATAACVFRGVGGAMSRICRVSMLCQCVWVGLCRLSVCVCVCTWLLGRLGRVARVPGRSLPITPCVLMSPAAVLGWLAMTNAATLGALPIDTVGAAGEGDAQAVAAWLDEGGGVEARCTEFDGTTRC